jgi:alpha-beta hydrolase superfamily lysophospholipase
MRWMLAIPLILSAAACDGKPAGNSATQNASLAAAAEPMTLKAADGVTIYGRFYKAAKPKALILLFHQAGSSKDEYATIAPRLVEAGYSALAIDQRAGGSLYGKNETASALGRDADYLEARPDLQAALDWAQTQGLPIVLWGSSYSSSLIFPLAADHPQKVVALLSFSPGEYFDSDKQMIRRAAAKVNAPVFVASTNSKEETGEADPIMAALPKNSGSVRFVPKHAVHGSSMLIASRNPEGAEANWREVLAFLNRVTAAK